ncbi:MAG: VOC family protein [Candidatus Kariarchaeaceae archaeon]|jgi:predicted enzyme related to lactoylglutathione lyase
MKPLKLNKTTIIVMIENISHAVIYTVNMKEALKFYSDVLELPIISESEYWSEVGFENSVHIGLHPVENLDSIVKTGARTEISFTVKNIEEKQDALKSKGVEFTREANEISPGRWVANFEDKDGNPLSLFEIKIN